MHEDPPVGLSDNKLKDQSFNVKELNPENVGIIGAASVSSADNTIFINRESGGRRKNPMVAMV